MMNYPLPGYGPIMPETPIRNWNGPGWKMNWRLLLLIMMRYLKTMLHVLIYRWALPLIKSRFYMVVQVSCIAGSGLLISKNQAAAPMAPGVHHRCNPLAAI